VAAHQPLIDPRQNGDSVGQLVYLLLNSIKSFLNVQLHTAAPLSERF
jgi:hypothetical protein